MTLVTGRATSGPLWRVVAVMTARRLVAGLLVLFAVSVVVFVATEIAPGDAASASLGPDAGPAAIEARRAELGLDRPAPLRYVEWLGGLFRGDLGVSYASGVPVADIVAARAGNSLLLGGLAAVLLLPLAVVLGAWAGLRAGRLADRAVSKSTLTLMSVPEFVTGTLLAVVFAVQLGWLPAVSFLPPGQSPLDRPEILVLPVITLLTVCLAHNTRVVRAGVAQSAVGEAAESARLNGVVERRVVWRYILPAALPPVVPLFARYVTFLLGGALIAETLFGYPGLASALVVASASRDVPVVQAVGLLAAAVTVLVNLAGDVVGTLLDPLRRVPR
ncbi:peptide/nickel transport system permease protein [Micromonospora tulbaghiae]|uniref:Peptide/nickel transport system permease protein n=2 Tax=Micromonospora tulbaghiae TaxID=479978 RepID=A0ABY0KHJ3_9ACTN|nr:peptide/nickel transport system permease protein [Micromonospora tulbaghiae]